MPRTPFRFVTPDARLEHLQYARDLEEERSARLDEMDTARAKDMQRQFQVELQRSSALDQRDEIGQQMQVEQARSADLDRREAEQRLQPPAPMTPLERKMQERWESGVGEEVAGRGIGLPGMPFGLGRPLKAVAEPAYEYGVKPAVRGVQYVEEPIAAAALGAVSRAGPLGGPALGPSQQITETPMERAPIGEELVNPVSAWLGDEEEQRKAREVLDEAGLPAELMAYFFTSPLNLLPVVGFTSGRGFLNTLRQAARVTGEARTAIVRSPRFQSTIRAITSEAGGPRVPGVGPEDVTRVTPERVPPPSRRASEPHVAKADPSGPPPRKPPPAKPRGPTPDDAEFDDIQRVALEGEKPEETLMRRHDGAVNKERNLARIDVEDGNTLLRQAKIGQSYKGTVVARTGQTDEFDELYRYLHNSSKVESGELVVPERMRPAYDKVREGVDFEQAARVDFDPEMALVEDYMYRGWKPPEGMFTGSGARGALGRRPGFKMPRVNATYDEMRSAGFEPLFWNPFEQARFSRMMGVKFREQMKLIDDIRKLELALPHTGGPIPKGWRVPRVGSAFEGKPFAKGDEVMFTRRWVVPDSLANRLENAYGVSPDLSTVGVLGKEVDLMKAIDALVFIPKRAKLIGSVFQHVDFLTRSYVGSWTGFVDALSHGQPVAAVAHLAKWPKTASEIVQAVVSPGYQQKLRRMAVDPAPLFKGRRLSMEMISDAGLSLRDPTLRIDVDKLAREAASQAPVVKGATSPIRLASEFERVHRKGLFQGMYPAATLTDIKNNIAPMFIRGSPKATDEQLAGMIAKFANTKYSLIPASQSVIQNRGIREFLVRLFFSLGEQEGLLRAFTGALWGPNTSYWRKHWLGAYIGLIAMANTIHFASTGEPLPWARWSPISKTKWGPLPIGYNRDFAAPNIPLTGRSGTELTLDLVGQLDTALRILDPASFLAARESVPVRAGLNQITGKDFFGAPIDTVGPGGVISRTSQLIQDMFAPIGPGQAALQQARSNIEGAEGIIQPGEDRLGTAGTGIQATGMNVRAETTPQLLDRIRTDVMREMGIEGRYEDIKAVDAPLANEIDDEVEARIGPELELRRETAQLRGQITPTGQFFEEQEVSRAQQGEEQLADDAKLNSGQWMGDVWREKFRNRQRDFFNRREGLKQAFKIEFEEREAPSGSVNAAIDAYFDVNVDDHPDLRNPGETDWGAFFEARDAALKGLSSSDRARVMKFIRKFDTPTAKEFRKAQKIVDKVFETPKYVGLSLEEGEEVDRILLEIVPRMQTVQLRQGVELERGQAVMAAVSFVKDPDVAKFLLTNFGPRLSVRQRRRKRGGRTITLEALSVMNPERDDILLENQDILALFYPDLLAKQLSREQEVGLGERAFATLQG